MTQNAIDAVYPWKRPGTVLSGPHKVVMYDIDASSLDARVSRETIEFNIAAGQFWRTMGRRHVTRVKVFHNPFLQERFARLKQQAHDHAGAPYAQEVFVFHGTTAKNAERIVREGFRVDVPVRCGRVYGTGIYCAKSPRTPIAYAGGAKFVLLCKALMGRDGVDSTLPRHDWVLFKTGAQLLPCYAVYYQ